MSTLIAVPSCLPGGLDAAMGMHFGKCDIFTLVEIEGTDIISVQALPNAPHEHGGCLAPVEILASQGVKALIAGGMGMRPLMGFAQAGINVHYAAGCATVKDAVQGYIEGRLPLFSQDFSCSCHHH